MWATNPYGSPLRGTWLNINCNPNYYILGAVCKKQQICNSVPPTTMLQTVPPSVKPTVSNSVKSTTTVGIGIP